MDDAVRWHVEQADLTAAVLSRKGGAPRRPVKVLWWTVSATMRRGPDFRGVLARVWSGDPSRGSEEHLFVALFEGGDAEGARPFLVVRARPGDVPSSAGRAVATAHGRLEPGGVLVVETRSGTIVPVEPPAEPGDDAPSWSETDPT